MKKKKLGSKIKMVGVDLTSGQPVIIESISLDLHGYIEVVAIKMKDGTCDWRVYGEDLEISLQE